MLLSIRAGGTAQVGINQVSIAQVGTAQVGIAQVGTRLDFVSVSFHRLSIAYIKPGREWSFDSGLIVLY